MCSAYKDTYNRLCEVMASLARILATKTLPQNAHIPFTSCRLIVLNKHPGVRPIGVCEVLRRILARAILQVISPNIVEACGFLQNAQGCLLELRLPSMP